MRSLKPSAISPSDISCIHETRVAPWRSNSLSRACHETRASSRVAIFNVRPWASLGDSPAAFMRRFRDPNWHLCGRGIVTASIGIYAWSPTRRQKALHRCEWRSAPGSDIPRVLKQDLLWRVRDGVRSDSCFRSDAVVAKLLFRYSQPTPPMTFLSCSSHYSWLRARLLHTTDVQRVIH